MTVIIVLLTVILVVYFVSAKRNISINYVGQQSRSSNTASAKKNYLPLKLNSAGVIPVIFASTLLMLPSLLKQVITEPTVTYWLDFFFDYQSGGFALIIYCLLIFAFSLLYSFVQINPKKVSDNLEKQNAYISGIRPGEDTSDYIESILYRITF